MRYEDALEEADDEGFCFPQATTAELQEALEVLLQQEEEEEEGEVEEEVEEEEVYDWEVPQEMEFD